jgi:hypothetical protein
MMAFLEQDPATKLNLDTISVRIHKTAWHVTARTEGFTVWLTGQNRIFRRKNVLCPFAVYNLRYAVTSFFTMYRNSLADGKRAGQKVHRKMP